MSVGGHISVGVTLSMGEGFDFGPHLVDGW